MKPEDKLTRIAETVNGEIEAIDSLLAKPEIATNKGALNNLTAKLYAYEQIKNIIIS